MKIEKANSSLNWQMQLLGDHAIVFSLPAQMDEKIVAQIQSLNIFIQSKNIKSFIDYIPAYHTLTIIYDIESIKTTLEELNSAKSIEQLGLQLLEDFLNIPITSTINDTNYSIIEIPVCYDLQWGMDLPSIADEKKINIEKIIQLHSSITYLVYCLGFMPGFAYMGKVDEKIQVARHEKPRAKVLAGSVGIAGAQTGIYPVDSPGGWKIIGRTPLLLFDPVHLSKLHVNDRVQFYPISLAEFEKLNKHS